MVIQCRKCGTRYRFDGTQLEGEGAWVRCSRCQNVFFQEKPSETEQASETSATSPVSALGRERRQKEKDAVAELPIMPEEDIGDEPQRRYWTPVKIAVYLIILLLVAGGVFTWLVPNAGRELLEAVPGLSAVADYLGIETPKQAARGGIELQNVRDHFVKNASIGDVMSIRGTAVNHDTRPVMKIRVKAKLLDAQDQIVGEKEVYCGNLISDEDLARLTEKEVEERLSIAEGRNPPDTEIAPEGKVPFIIVFMNPPKNADKFIVETVSMERR